jgi:hypothetical protein
MYLFVAIKSSNVGSQTVAELEEDSGHLHGPPNRELTFFLPALVFLA